MESELFTCDNIKRSSGDSEGGVDFFSTPQDDRLSGTIDCIECDVNCDVLFANLLWTSRVGGVLDRNLMSQSTRSN